MFFEIVSLNERVGCKCIEGFNLHISSSEAKSVLAVRFLFKLHFNNNHR